MSNITQKIANLTNAKGQALMKIAALVQITEQALSKKDLEDELLAELETMPLYQHYTQTRQDRLNLDKEVKEVQQEFIETALKAHHDDPDADLILGEVKIVKEVDYDEVPILLWVFEHGFDNFVNLNRTEFEKFAKQWPTLCPPIYFDEVPKFYFDRKYLAELVEKVRGEEEEGDANN